MGMGMLIDKKILLNVILNLRGIIWMKIILYDTHINICITWMREDARGCERRGLSTLGGCRQLGEKVVDTSGSDWYSTAANNTLSQSAAV
jgi:hypothetical protein